MKEQGIIKMKKKASLQVRYGVSLQDRGREVERSATVETLQCVDTVSPCLSISQVRIKQCHQLDLHKLHERHRGSTGCLTAAIDNRVSDGTFI